MTNHFTETLQYFNSKKIKLPTATSSDLELIKYIRKALTEIYKPGYKYKKSGVVVTEIILENNVQLNLLDTRDHGKEFTLMQFIDDLTEKFGRDTVSIAAQGTHKKKAWNLNREFLSSCYTTRLSQVLTIKI